jgi:hypothetical protein
MKFDRIPLIWGILSVLLFSACGPSESGWDGRIEVRDGVSRVMNPDVPLYPDAALNLEEDLVITGSEDHESQMLQDIRTLDVDELGNIFILDEGAADIKVFDSAGRHLRTIGRKGQGPGEFGLPVGIIITPKREILVYDMEQRALKFLSLEGIFIRQLSTADKFQFTGPRFTPDGRMVASYLVPADEPTAELRLFNPELDPLYTLVSLPVTPPPVLHFFAARSMTGLRWNVNHRGEIIWGDFLSPEYVLHVHDQEGNHIRTLTRKYDALPVTEGDKEALLRLMFGENPPPQWDIRFPEQYPPFSGFSCDDGGRIYVKVHVKVGAEAGEHYDVFDAEGRYAARISLPVPLMVLKKGYLYTITENELGFREVRRFKMNWEPDI